MKTSTHVRPHGRMLGVGAGTCSLAHGNRSACTRALFLKNTEDNTEHFFHVSTCVLNTREL